MQSGGQGEKKGGSGKKCVSARVGKFVRSTLERGDWVNSKRLPFCGKRRTKCSGKHNWTQTRTIYLVKNSRRVKRRNF